MGEGDFDKMILGRVEQLGLKGRLILTDFRQRHRKRDERARRFCHAFLRREFRQRHSRAISSGLPVIGTNSGGTPRIPRSGRRCRLLCEPKSADALAQGMLRMLSEPSYRQILGRQARAKALREYDMKKVFQRIESLVRPN